VRGARGVEIAHLAPTHATTQPRWEKMNTVFHVIKEEYDRLLEAEQLYTGKIGDLPKGKPRIKQVNGTDYLYLNRREGAKIVDEYVGRADSDKAREVLALVEKRERFIQLRKDVRARLKNVKKVLRGKI
jgi:hypothetical protein